MNKTFSALLCFILISSIGHWSPAEIVSKEDTVKAELKLCSSNKECIVAVGGCGYACVNKKFKKEVERELAERYLAIDCKRPNLPKDSICLRKSCACPNF
jgi:hypothetical protein